MIGLPLAFVVNLVVARSIAQVHTWLRGSCLIHSGGRQLAIAVLNAGVSDATIQWRMPPPTPALTAPRSWTFVAVAPDCHILIEAPLAAAVPVHSSVHRTPISTQVLAATASGVTMVLGTSAVVLAAMSMNAVLAKLSLFVDLQCPARRGHQLPSLHMQPRRSLRGVSRSSKSCRRSAQWYLQACGYPPGWRSALLLPRGWPGFYRVLGAHSCGRSRHHLGILRRCEVLILDAYGATAAAGAFALAAGPRVPNHRANRCDARSS